MTMLIEVRRGRRRALAAAAALLGMTAATSADAAEFVRAKGRVMIKDENGALVPLAHVQVRLMDSDSDFDEELSMGHTDENGNYNLLGHGGDSPCIGCSKPDPYVKVVLEEPGVVEVHDIMHFTRNSVITPTAEEASGTVDFGTRVYPNEYPEWNAAILFLRTKRAYAKFKSLSGDVKVPGNGGEVAVEIPVVLSGGVPYTTWDTIHWPGHYTGWGSFDHEFGHRIRHAKDGDVGHFNNDVVKYQYARHHDVNDITNEGFAFNEGWAHYFRHEVNPSYMNSPWTGHKAPNVEGWVAHKLIALAKDCGGFAPMWATLESNREKIHSWKEFAAAFTKQKPQCGFQAPEGGVPMPGSPPASVATDEVVKQQAMVRAHLDAIDARGAALRIRPTPRAVSGLAAVSTAPLQRLQAKRVQRAQAWDASARAAYRRLVSGIAPASEASLDNGARAREVRAARDAFVTAVFESRLRDVQEIRRDIAAERSKTRDAALLANLAATDGKYQKLEAKLARVLAARGTPDLKVPSNLLPRSFSGL